MDDFAAKIEALEHRWMRAWSNGDEKEMKGLASRDFIFLFASTEPKILDRASWIDAAPKRLRCKSYRFGNVYVRRHGSVAVFAAPVELDAAIDHKPLIGSAFVADVWRRSRVRRRWQLLERVLTPAHADAEASSAVRSMQLWR